MSNIHTTVDALIELVNTGDEVDRCFASKTLGKFKDRRATATLIEHLRDEDIDVCIDAAEALGKINDPQALPALLESLKNDPDGEVKTMITESLGHFSSEDALQALLQLAAGEPEDLQMDEGDDWNDWWDMQLKSVKALGQQGEKRAIPVLTGLLEDDENMDIEPEILKSLAQIGDKGIDALLEVLNTSRERSRRRAIHAISYSKDPRTSKILGRGLQDRDSSVRATAIEGLSRNHATSYLGAILLSLKDVDADVRGAALNFIADLQQTQIDAEAMQQITAQLTDPDKDILLNTLNVLNKLNNSDELLTTEDWQQIQSILNHKDFTVQAAACNLLGKCRQMDALHNILKLANDKEQNCMARREAINAITELATEHTETIDDELIANFSRWVLDESQPVRQAALYNLPRLNASLTEENKITVLPIEIVIQAACGELSSDIGEKSSLHNSDRLNNIAVSVEQPQTNTPATRETEYHPAESTLDTQPAQQSAMSTLEALSMDNVEMTLHAEAQKSPKKESLLTAEEMQEDEEYFELLEANIKRGNKIKAPKVDAKTDSQYLALRQLGQQNDEQSINILIDALDSHDITIRHEAISALGQIALQEQPHKALLNSLGRLVTLMHSDGEDNRLASVKTLGDMQHRGAIVEIISHLNDQDYHVRLHSIYALGKLCRLQIERSDNDPEDHMVINELLTEDIIDEINKVLDDSEPGVQMAAIETLLSLNPINDQSQQLEKIIQIALDDQGALTRRIAQLLRNNHDEKSGDVLLEKMKMAEDSAHRRFIIEMLEELYKPEAIAA